MNTPKVSIIIPAYNGAASLPETIRSILDQTFSKFEIIIVDDCSTDQTSDQIKRFADPRIKYIRHPKNLGASQARVTGIRESSGEIITFLDQDDLYHPEKLAKHVAFMTGHPDVGMTYNARFHLGHSSKAIQDIWRPPTNLTLADIVSGFPISPSDMVFTRYWGTRYDMWEGNFGISGGEIILLGRLFLAGCKFGSVNQALNYRRYHGGRVFSKLAQRCESELRCQAMILEDPRCPPQIAALRNIAFANTYMGFGIYALAQNEVSLGQEYLQKAVQLNPSIIQGTPCSLTISLIDFSAADETQNYEDLSRCVFSRLPSEMTQVSAEYDWALARGYVVKGMRAVMWNQLEEGDGYLSRAIELGATIDESLIQRFTFQLLSYEVEFGAQATQQAIDRLVTSLKKLAGQNGVRRLRGSYFINHAFQNFRAGYYSEVPKQIMRAIADDLRYITNRGVLSILLRSTIGRISH